MIALSLPRGRAAHGSHPLALTPPSISGHRGSSHGRHGDAVPPGGTPECSAPSQPRCRAGSTGTSLTGSQGSGAMTKLRGTPPRRNACGMRAGTPPRQAQIAPGCACGVEIPRSVLRSGRVPAAALLSAATLPELGFKYRNNPDWACKATASCPSRTERSIEERVRRLCRNCECRRHQNCNHCKAV